MASETLLLYCPLCEGKVTCEAHLEGHDEPATATSPGDSMVLFFEKEWAECENGCHQTLDWRHPVCVDNLTLRLQAAAEERLREIRTGSDRI